MLAPVSAGPAAGLGAADALGALALPVKQQLSSPTASSGSSGGQAAPIPTRLLNCSVPVQLPSPSAAVRGPNSDELSDEAPGLQLRLLLPVFRSSRESRTPSRPKEDSEV